VKTCMWKKCFFSGWNFAAFWRMCSLFEKSASPNQENRPGHSTRIVLLMLCLRCHELCLSQTMLPDSDHTQQHCYFADMAYETKCVRIACPYQQSSNAGLLPWCCQLMCMWLFLISFCVSCSYVLSWKRWVGR
jgi:hypothetical protein